jgi:hypothetical protein
MSNVVLDFADLSTVELKNVIGLANKWFVVHKILNFGGEGENLSG